MALTNKQRAFVDLYLDGDDGERWNATAAAKKAGYSERTAAQIGYENLRKPEIAAAIAQRLQALQMSADEALVRLTAQARGSIADVITLDETGGWQLDLQQAQARGTIGLIKRIEATKYGTRVELYDAQAALMKIGEHHQLFGKPIDLLKHIDLSRLRPDQVRRIADGEDPLAVLLAPEPDPPPSPSPA